MSFPLLFSPDQLILSGEEGCYPEVISWVLNRWYMSPAWWRNTVFPVGCLHLSLDLFSNSSRSPLLLISSPLLCSQSPPSLLSVLWLWANVNCHQISFFLIFRKMTSSYAGATTLQLSLLLVQPVFKKDSPHSQQSINKISSGQLIPIYSNSIQTFEHWFILSNHR